MPSQSRITNVDELIGLVAGTLNPEDFVRVAKAVKNDAALQAQLAGLERIRSELIDTMVFDKRPAAVETFAGQVLQRAMLSGDMQAQAITKTSWASRLGKFFVVSLPSARLAYGLVVVQAVGIAWLLGGALQVSDESTATSTRSAGIESKQLGTVPGSVTFSVSFDPATPEATVRGLLLEMEAQIIAGPSRLGEYKIAVVRNRSHMALLKLREAAFVEQFTEISREAQKPEPRDGDKK